MDPYQPDSVLEQTSPAFLVEMWYQGTEFVASYGWYLLAAGVLLICFWNRIRDSVDKMIEKREEKAYEAKCKKDPDLVKSQQEAMEAARRKMQEQLNIKAQEYAAKMKEKEEKKRAEILAKADSGGHVLGNGSEPNTTDRSKKEKESLHTTGYNPLWGSDNSRRYRPPRRSVCPSGGCG